MAKAGKPRKSDPKVDNMVLDIEKNCNEKVEKLLNEIGIDAFDSYSRTALIWASFYNNIELLNWLIENHADLNHKDRNGYSALHFAGQEKHESLFKFKCLENRLLIS